MGLAAPKNRSRISHDPQNTAWAHNTSRFGHKILTTQGWEPGTSLGAKNASHAAHYTAASHSHIRVLLKENNLGLGAKIGSQRPENFGLAGLESILGRLNGREAEVKVEEERRAEIERRGYVAQKYGSMNFVSGGFLLGGDIVSKSEMKKELEVEVKVEVKKEEEGDRSIMEIEEKKVKKRKRTKEENDDIELKQEEDELPRLKRKKKSMDLRAVAKAEEEAISSSSSRKEKKEKKDKQSSKHSRSATETPSSEPLSDKAKRKAEKRARKEEKKLKKALKRAAKEAARSNAAQEPEAGSSSSEDETADSPATTSVSTTGTSTPTLAPRGHHIARQKYIRQKKMASMDPQALKEIFMIKTPS